MRTIIQECFHLRRLVRYSLLLAAVLLSGSATSQDSLLNLRPNIKFSPLHLINTFATVQLAYEQPVIKGLSVQLETGFTTRSLLFNSYNINDVGGWKFREDIRYYFEYNAKKRKAFYVAYELVQNYLHFYRTGYETVCDDPECKTRTSVKIGPYKIRFRESGSGVKVGYTKFYSRFILDLNIGACLHRLRWDFPEGVEPYRRGTIGFPLEYLIADERNHSKILPSLGFRVGYHLGKRR